jgi:hypothetical protein
VLSKIWTYDQMVTQFPVFYVVVFKFTLILPHSVFLISNMK